MSYGKRILPPLVLWLALLAGSLMGILASLRFGRLPSIEQQVIQEEIGKRS